MVVKGIDCRVLLTHIGLVWQYSLLVDVARVTKTTIVVRDARLGGGDRVFNRRTGRPCGWRRSATRGLGFSGWVVARDAPGNAWVFDGEAR